MTVLIPTKSTGAQVRPLPGTYAESAQRMSDEERGRFMAGHDLNGPFLADLLSGMITHERCGRHLYRSIAGRTNNPMLARRYREFGEQTERHVEILDDLIRACGGNPQYVSPMARAVQGMDTKLLESTFVLAGSVDLMSQEMAMLDAVLQAETIDHANWSTLGKLTESLPNGDLRERFASAVRDVERDEDDHLDWAATTRQRIVMMQLEHQHLSTATATAEEMVARVRRWFDGG